MFICTLVLKFFLNLTFGLLGTIFCHICSRTEKITFPKGVAVGIFASRLVFNFLFC